MSKASFIILTRNRKDLLKKCLDSLKKYERSNQIIVVDNNSEDGTLEMLEKYKKDIQLIKNRKNLGVGKGRNIGIKKAKGDYLIFLDDDTYIANTTFKRIIKFMDENKEIGIVGPKILYPSGKLQESARTFPTPLSLLWRGTFLSKFFPNMKFYSNYLMKDKLNKVQEVDWVMGACLVIRRKAIEQIGMFDDQYFLVYDDVDFCFRAGKKDWKVVYYPDSLIYHYYARTSAKGFLNVAKLRHILAIIRFFLLKYKLR